MRVKNSRRLGQLAVEAGLLQPQQLHDALAAQAQIAAVGCHKRLGEVLIEKDLLAERQIAELLRVQREQHQRRHFAEHEIHEKLGEGGMGAVYRATRHHDGKVVAMKVLARALTDQPEFVERFMRESRVAQDLDHPHLVRALDVGCEDGRYYLTMTYAPGESLDQLIRAERRLGEGRALEIARQLADALDYVATRNVVHRDIKPGNVIVDPDDHARLLDLGLARNMDDRREQITVTGQIMGTPDFMAPEQILGQDVDGRADIYALGATLYTMVTGQAPFAGRNDAQAVLMGHLSGTFRDPIELVPGLSEGTLHVIEKSMATLPADRYASAAVMVRDIDQVLAGCAPETERLEASKTMVSRASIRRSARRPGAKRRRRGPGRSRARAGLPSWAVFSVGAAGVAMIALLVLTLGGGEVAEPTAAAEPVARIPAAPLPDRAPVSAQRPPRVRVADPMWGVGLIPPDGWTVRLAADRGPVRLVFEGPGGEAGALHVTPKPEGAGEIPLGATVRAVSRGVPGAVAMALEVGRLRVHGYSSGAGVVVWYQTREAVHRLVAENMSQPAVLDLVGRLSPDPAIEKETRRSLAIETAPHVSSDQRVRFGVPESARRHGTGAVSEFRSADGVLYVASAATNPAAQLAAHAPGFNGLDDGEVVSYATHQGTLTSGHVAGQLHIQLGLAGPGGLCVIGCRFGLHGAGDAGWLAFWGLLGSVTWAPREPRVEPAPGAGVLGIPPGKVIAFWRYDSKTFEMTGTGSFMLTPKRSAEKAAYYVLRTSLYRRHKGKLLKHVENLLVAPGGRAAFMTHARFLDDKLRRETYVYDAARKGWWFGRGGKDSSARKIGEGPSDGVYEPGAFPLYAAWLGGLDIRLGARRTLQVVDGIAGTLRRLTLTVGEKNSGLVFVRFEFDNGHAGALAVSPTGQLQFVRDGADFLTLERRSRKR